MEKDKHDTAAATKGVNAKPKTASQTSGAIQVVRCSLAGSAPSIESIEALAGVQSPAPQPQQHGTVREAEPPGDIYKLDDQDCGGPSR